MYIEFPLPHGISTRVMSEAIKASIAIWADKYSVPPSALSQKTIKYTHRLGFTHEKYFSLFSMTWDQFDFQIVNIANERY
jgi:hypothetical protein